MRKNMQRNALIHNVQRNALIHNVQRIARTHIMQRIALTHKKLTHLNKRPHLNELTLTKLSTNVLLVCRHLF
jgi:hypothetical protein